MDTTVHGRIAYIISQELMGDFEGCINIRALVIGSMLPDLNLRFRFKSHNKKGIDKEVYQWIKDLFYSSEFSNRENMNEKFYKKLGIVLHFLCDFFCTPHNDSFTKGLIAHEIYEKKQDFMYSNKLSKLLGEASKDFKLDWFQFKELIDYIEELHGQYLITPSDHKTDLLFALKCSKVVTHSLLAYKLSYIKPIITQKVVASY